MTNPLLRRLLAGLFVGTLLTAVGCAAESGDEPEAAGNQDDDSDPTASSADALGGCNQCTNCVLYARCRQPRLPHGLTTYGQKAAVINSHNPRRGCVAIIRTGSSYGHVAYVNGVSGSTVHIDEGNWPSGHCGGRSGTAGALNISGYYCP